MANNRNKKKINSKQANRISWIISGIYFIYMFINGLVSKPVGDFATYYWSIGLVVGTLLIYLFISEFVFKVGDKEKSEREQKIEIATRRYLSNSDYKQVYFLYECCDIMDMIIQILEKEGCKFYAKLTENNNIHLVVKDKHNEEVYSAEIENLIYFNTNFKFDE